MKLFFLSVIIFSLSSIHCFAQIVQKRNMQKSLADTTKKLVAKSTVLPQSKMVKQSDLSKTSKSQLTATKKMNVSQQSTVSEKRNQLKVIPYKKVPIPPDISKASLLDVFFKLQTAMAQVNFTFHSYNKDPDTHWSFGIFDQNERSITSFHDDSDNDEYPDGSITGPLKMSMVNAAVFGDFSNGGHIHINIAPKGNDEWRMDNFSITLDFLNPKTSQTITWYGLLLTQDKRDADLYFYYDGKDFVAR